MTKIQLLGALVGLGLVAGAVHAYPPRFTVGIGIGVPVYRPYYGYGPYYGPYAPYGPYYYGPPAVVVAPPPPVVYQQAPGVVVAQPPQQAPVAQAAPQNAPPQQPTFQPASNVASVDGYLANLRNTDEAVRRDSVLELGRMRSLQAVQPLTATLAGDQSPVVREAAARALGLISSQNALVALQHAAQADPDRDVRRSAQFAVDVIRTNPR